MDRLSYDINNIIFQFSDLTTIKNCKTINKYFEKICLKYLLQNYLFQFSFAMINEQKMYEKYKNITKLKVFNLHDILPFPNLKQLIFYNEFNQRIETPLPDKLTHITFGFKFN